MTRHYTDRSFWTQDQIDLMNDLLDYAEKYGRKIPWRDHEDTLGHPYSSIITMASKMRTARSKERMRKENAVLRAAANMLSECDQPAPQKPRAAQPPAPKQCLALDDERIATTSTQGLMFLTELRNRFGDHASITAGVLGDPPPGRSALDRKRAGLTDAPAPRFGRPQAKPSL